MYAVVDEEGKVLSQGRVANEPEALGQMVNDYTPAKVVMEATGNWYHLYDLLEGMVDDVCLAHPLRAKAISAAKVKTDKVDATTLAQLLRADLIPTSYIPPRPIRELREVLRQRASLMRLATQIKNKIHALLIRNGLVHPFSDLFGCAGRQWLSGLQLRPVYRQALEADLRVLDLLQVEVKQLDQEIARVAKEDGQAQLLTSVPGIGRYSALIILAEIGDVHRFPDAKHLISFAGLAPTVHSSGG